MNIHIATILAGAAFGLLSLAACDQIMEANEAAAREAEAQTRGEATLGDDADLSIFQNHLSLRTVAISGTLARAYDDAKTADYLFHKR